MLVKHCEEGKAVRLKDEPETHGVILKRDGQRVRVDLSASGGPDSKWVHCRDLEEAPGDDDIDLDAMAAELGGGESPKAADDSLDLESMAAEL
jgi:hypothetical protein